MRPEPTSIFCDGFYALREVAGKLKNWPNRLAVRRAARQLSYDAASEPSLNYGHMGESTGSTLPIGGQIKLIPLQQSFPPKSSANLLYLVSSALPPDVEELVKVAKKNGIRLVWNQNGVAYPGCYGDYYAWFNLRMAGLRAKADYIFNQSEFSRTSAERYLGPSSAPSEICFNPVDTQMFSPSENPPPQSTWEILAAGTSHALYRTKSALDTLKALLSRGHPARLTIAGEFRWKGAAEQVEKEMKGIREHVRILPPFRQSEAPGIYRHAHVLLHTKFNDPCPTVPIEAMSCGIPVVGTCSGGMPELVPEKAGILVPISESWTQDLPGDPELLASAVEKVMQSRQDMFLEARQHAVRTFDVNHWLARHDEVFRKMVAS